MSPLIKKDIDELFKIDRWVILANSVKANMHTWKYIEGIFWGKILVRKLVRLNSTE